VGSGEPGTAAYAEFTQDEHKEGWFALSQNGQTWTWQPRAMSRGRQRPACTELAARAHQVPEGHIHSGTSAMTNTM